MSMLSSCRCFCIGRRCCILPVCFVCLSPFLVKFGRVGAGYIVFSFPVGIIVGFSIRNVEAYVVGRIGV